MQLELCSKMHTYKVLPSGKQTTRHHKYTFYENKKSATLLIHLYSLWFKLHAIDFVKVTTVDKEKYFNPSQIFYVLDWVEQYIGHKSFPNSNALAYCAKE